MLAQGACRGSPGHVRVSAGLCPQSPAPGQRDGVAAKATRSDVRQGGPPDRRRETQTQAQHRGLPAPWLCDGSAGLGDASLLSCVGTCLCRPHVLWEAPGLVFMPAGLTCSRSPTNLLLSPASRPSSAHSVSTSPGHSRQRQPAPHDAQPAPSPPSLHPTPHMASGLVFCGAGREVQPECPQLGPPQPVCLWGQGQMGWGPGAGSAAPVGQPGSSPARWRPRGTAYPGGSPRVGRAGCRPAAAWCCGRRP